MGDLYLGVDGGASATRAVVLDPSATIHGYGHGGNANHQGQGVERAMAHVAEAVHSACDSAGCSLDTIALAHFALAGDDTEDDHAALTAQLARLLPLARIRLSNDVWAGLRAGSVSGAGVAVNCGSGCGGVGRDAAGQGVIIPDLGYSFGDSGGGMQIAVDAVRAVIRAWDGRGEPTALTQSILDLTGQPDVPALYLAMCREQVARRTLRPATRLVFEAAAAGDAVAIAILQRIGTELGVTGAAIVRHLGLQDTAFPFVLTGGTFRTLQSPLAQATIARMRQTAPYCRPTLPRIMPVAAAGLLALDAAGREVGEGHYVRLQEHGYSWHAEETY